MSTEQRDITYLPYTDTRSRNTDPRSSHAAEAEMKRSGKMPEQAEQVLALIKQFPGCTSKQLGCAQSKLDRYQVARRCSDLEFMNLVYATGRDHPGQIRWWSERRKTQRTPTPL